MFKLSTITNAITSNVGHKALVLQKMKPEILVGLGVVGVVASTIMACKATLKVDSLLDDTQATIGRIKDAHEGHADEYSEQDYKKDMVIAYTQAGYRFIKLYGPSVALSVASIACIVSSHSIMRQRNLAIMAAYKAVEQGFNSYRERVIAELGEDKDRQFKYGIRKEQITVEEEGEDGKKRKVKQVLDVVDPKDPSTYARFFDESSKEWTKTPEYNLVFLKAQQNYANDLLHARGHLFLNEVYDMLGIPRSQAGAVVGWLMGKGDDFVDFGIFDVNYAPNRDFVNGYERSILLDFNVDGVIYDLI